jgi:galactokinase
MSDSPLRLRFRERYGAVPRVFQAPGRVNLIGEHTDYNEGFVFPMAIGFTTRVAAAPRAGRRIQAFSENFQAAHTCDLDDPGSPRGGWGDYVTGVAVLLERSGVHLCGADLLIESDVPIGAGLSSSAALEVSVALALVGVAGAEVGRLTLARLCQQAEHEFAGARCGLMDQFTACFGREGHALCLDCRTMEYEAEPLPAGVAVVLCNSMVRHELAAGEYNQRRQDCEAAAAELGVRALRDVTPARLAQADGRLPPRLLRRARHVVTENGRVQQAAAALRQGDAAGFGALMFASHASLRADFEVSCAELDTLVELARQAPGVLGARMTGGGFGGCTVNLVEAGQASAFAECMRAGYLRATGIEPAIYPCQAAAGAGEAAGA